MVDALNRLLSLGVSRTNPKRDLARILSVLRSLEDEARLSYVKILERYNLSKAQKKLIDGIRLDEVKHVKLVEDMIKVVEGIVDLEIVEFKVPKSD